MIAIDAFSQSSGVDPSHTHTPVLPTPHGVALVVVHATSETPAAPIYGGVASTLVERVNHELGGELGSTTISHYRLPSGIPSGPVTVSVDSGATGALLYVLSFSSATTTVEPHASVALSQLTGTNPTTTLALGGTVAVVFEAFVSGTDTVGGTNPFATWTDRFELDAGTIMHGFYTYDVVDDVDVSCGAEMAVGDDFFMLAIAYREGPAAARPFRSTLSARRV